ncbi:MAG: STAS domain-containing protein [SAR324 cluster bacterium]|nr:STAS domain-containing protein [SAR324 cluster bacterium]
MKINHYIDNDICVVEFNLEIDEEEHASDVVNYFESMFESEEFKKILLNCKNMISIDSTGIGIIFHINKLLNIKLESNTTTDKNGNLAVCNLNKECQEVFEICSMEPLIMMFQTEAEALKYLHLKK